MSILPPCSIVTLLRYVSIELKELLTYLLIIQTMRHTLGDRHILPVH